MRRHEAANRVLAALLAVAAARADDTVSQGRRAPAPSNRPWLFGDWNGERTRLKETGHRFPVRLHGRSRYNATGGIEERCRLCRPVRRRRHARPREARRHPAAQFQATITAHRPQSQRRRRTRHIQQVQEVDGRGQTTRLTQFWYRREFAERTCRLARSAAWASAKILPRPATSRTFTFCGSDPSDIVGDYIYNWPISQWGARLKFSIENFGYIQAGVYDVNRKYLGVSKALLPVSVRPTRTGALIPVELASLPPSATAPWRAATRSARRNRHVEG